MLSYVRLRVLALVLILAASCPSLGDTTGQYNVVSDVTIRFKEPTPPAAIQPMPAPAHLPVVVFENSGRKRRTTPAASRQRPITPIPVVHPVQYEDANPAQADAPPPTVTHNPLDDLQKDLQLADADRLGGMFDELTEVALVPQDDTARPTTRESKEPSPSIDDILGESPVDEETATADEEAVEPFTGLDTGGSDASDDATIVSSEPVWGTTGLRDDAYYQSLGTPKRVRQARAKALPLTMGDVFGDDDEYDPACVRRYCETVWQCAGGRDLNCMGRSWRDFSHNWQFRRAQNCGYEMPHNNFKCKKVSGEDCGCQQGGYQAFGADGYPRVPSQYLPKGAYGPIMKNGEMIYVVPHGGLDQAEMMEQLSEIGELEAPTPATAP